MTTQLGRFALCARGRNCKCRDSNQNSCYICQDNFTRADNTDLNTGATGVFQGCGWTESSGSWAIASNAMVCTSAGTVVCNTAHPRSEPLMSLGTKLGYDTSGGTISLCLGYQDANNYIAGRITFGATGAKLEIIQVVGGSETVRKTQSIGNIPVGAAAGYTAGFCYQPSGWATLTVFGIGAVSATITATVAGGVAAINVTGAGVGYFDDVVIRRVRDPDVEDDQPCPSCGVVAGTCTIGAFSSFQHKIILPAEYLSANIDLSASVSQSCAPLSGTPVSFGLLDATHEFDIAQTAVSPSVGFNPACPGDCGQPGYGKVLVARHACAGNSNPLGGYLFLSACLVVVASTSGGPTYNNLAWQILIRYTYDTSGGTANYCPGLYAPIPKSFDGAIWTYDTRGTYSIPIFHHTNGLGGGGTSDNTDPNYTIASDIILEAF